MSALSDPRVFALGKQAMDMVMPTLVENLTHEDEVLPHIQTAGVAVSAALAVAISNIDVLLEVLGR